MASNRRPTPLATPSVRPPPPSSGTRTRGIALTAPVRLLTTTGPLDYGVHAVVTFGRDPACDVVLDDPLVSRRHARMVVLLDEVILEDLQSSNGVYVNGARIERRTSLHAGDRILMGTTEISVFSPRGS